MSRVIWKEPLDAELVSDGSILCRLKLPGSAQILHVDDQRGQLCAWFSVLEGDQTSHREFQIAVVPTGGKIPERGVTPRYLSTVLQNDGQYVWHIFLL